MRERQDQKRKELRQPRKVVRGKVLYSSEEVAHLTLRRILPAGFGAGIVGSRTCHPAARWRPFYSIEPTSLRKAGEKRTEPASVNFS